LDEHARVAMAGVAGIVRDTMMDGSEALDAGGAPSKRRRTASPSCLALAVPPSEELLRLASSPEEGSSARMRYALLQQLEQDGAPLVRETVLGAAQAATRHSHARMRTAREEIRVEEARIEQHVRTRLPIFDRYKDLTRPASVPSSENVQKERKAMRQELVPATEVFLQATRAILDSASSPQTMAVAAEERVLGIMDGAIARFEELLGILKDARPEVEAVLRRCSAECAPARVLEPAAAALAADVGQVDDFVGLWSSQVAEETKKRRDVYERRLEGQRRALAACCEADIPLTQDEESAELRRKIRQNEEKLGQVEQDVRFKDSTVQQAQEVREDFDRACKVALKAVEGPGEDSQPPPGRRGWLSWMTRLGA